MESTVILTDGTAKELNNGNPVNGTHTIQVYGTFNSSTIQIQFKILQSGTWTPITNSSLEDINITSNTGFEIGLTGYVRAIATSGTPTSVTVVIKGR